MDLPPYTCNQADEVLDIFLIDPDGMYYNVARMRECDAEWTCRAYEAIGMGMGWTWFIRGGPETYPPGYMTPPADPPVDPEPEPPVQSEPPTNPA